METFFIFIYVIVVSEYVMDIEYLFHANGIFYDSIDIGTNAKTSISAGVKDAKMK